MWYWNLSTTLWVDLKIGASLALSIFVQRLENGKCLGNITKLECGPMPNAIAAMPNIGGALCSMPQSLADAHY